MTSNTTDTFIDRIYALSRESYPDAVVLQAKRCLLDYLGAAFAGAHLLREKGDALLAYMDADEGNASIIGFSRRSGILSAALMNGLSAHVAELDDGVRFGALHPGAPILSALLPVAQKEGVQGADLLRGVIVGYEAAIRIATAIQPSHYQMGYHPTATCGSIGAAVGAAAMLSFSPQQMSDALSAAAISASGMLKVIEGSSELKPFNSGRAALTGVLSSSMARAGFRGVPDVLYGPIGFLSMMSGVSDAPLLAESNANGAAIQKIYFKPYASCRHTHPAVEAVLTIRNRTGVRVEEIESITVTTYEGVLGKHDHTEVAGVSSAKMSIPYSVAIAAEKGTAGLDEFSTENVNNTEVLALAKKVAVRSDKDISAAVPDKRAAVVEIRTHCGRAHTERVDYPKGEPENPLSNEEICEKFRMLFAYGNGNDKRGHDIVDIVWNVEDELHKLFCLL